MKRLIVFLLVAISSCAQAQFFSQCLDESRLPNDYYQCPAEFNPVCGCDNVTYRNECTAIYWGGLFPFSYTTNTTCGGFFFDFYPTAASYLPGTFNLFMKAPGPATMYIFDVYGRLFYQRNFIATFSGQKFSEEVPVDGFDLGIYNMIVIAAGEKQTMKFAKVVQDTD